MFDVSLEGQVVKAGLDLAMEAGLGNLHVETFQVDVTDGTLDLDFVATAGAAAVTVTVEVEPPSDAVSGQL